MPPVHAPADAAAAAAEAAAAAAAAGAAVAPAPASTKAQLSAAAEQQLLAFFSLQDSLTKDEARMLATRVCFFQVCAIPVVNLLASAACHLRKHPWYAPWYGASLAACVADVDPQA